MIEDNRNIEKERIFNRLLQTPGALKKLAAERKYKVGDDVTLPGGLVGSITSIHEGDSDGDLYYFVLGKWYSPLELNRTEKLAEAMAKFVRPDGEMKLIGINRESGKSRN
jgi:hypothetical protein